MEQWKSDDFSAALAPSKAQLPSLPTPSRSHSSHSDSRQRPDVEIKDQIVARKVQKADREKLRRDRLNEQFLELGNTLDPDRPKNDKATILTDTIQMLKDLTSDVNRLKTEYTALSEESHELTQEKNELREEKASLKSDIENLNVQYQQRLRVMYPWAGIDPSSVVMCPRYSYPMPIHIPPGQVPMHPSLQPFPFFRGQHPGAIPAPCSTLVSYPTPANPPAEKLSAQHATTSHVSSDSRSKSSDHHRGRNGERCVDSTDVATDLELKMPGTSAQQDSSSAGRKGKYSQRRERSSSDGSSSCRYSSSQVLLDSSYSSVGMPKP